MESNSCGKNNLNLPPRKRLLAGLKKCNFDQQSDSSENSLFGAGVNSLMKSHLGNPHLSLEEALEASRTAAESALKLAAKAKAVAAEKAEIAATKMAIAKKALDFLASLTESGESNERRSKKNRMRPKKRRRVITSEMDEQRGGNHGGQKSNGNGLTDEVNNGGLDENMSNHDKHKVAEGDGAERSH